MKRLLQLDDKIDFSLLGISCHIKDYRLSWEINRALEIDLVKGSVLHALDKKNDFGFSTSEYYDEENLLEYVLINNKNEGGVLISDHPQLDYLFRLSGPQHEFELQLCKEKLNGIQSMLAVMELNPEGLKSKMNLVF